MHVAEQFNLGFDYQNLGSDISKTSVIPGNFDCYFLGSLMLEMGNQHNRSNNGQYNELVKRFPHGEAQLRPSHLAAKEITFIRERISFLK